jgi:threonylcarbamoyladenosine tRNA methylthiotransferase MtaB
MLKDRKRRTGMYINLSEKKLRAFYEKHLGTAQTVLCSNRKKTVTDMCGFTENYIKVETPFRKELINKLQEVELQSILPNGHVAVKN